jgi:acetyltransferase-like isoleucine patch superfamily enzyme
MILERILNKLMKPYYKMVLGSLGRQTLISPFVKIEKPNNIFLGKNISIGRMSWLEANPLTGRSTCKIIVGDGTYIGNVAHIYCTSKIEIGKNVLLADRVYISDNLHEYVDIQTPVIMQPIKQLKEVKIGDGAWLGENVCILGSDVGKQSVIGANSVVTKSIPDFCVAVGAPAKIIKRYSFEKQAWLKTDGDGNIIEE